MRDLRRRVGRLPEGSPALTALRLGYRAAYLAREAFACYGKGRAPAGLNFGDCCSYALARATDKPLLFKGSDFSQTDVKSALV